jgi:hypothetical protein
MRAFMLACVRENTADTIAAIEAAGYVIVRAEDEVTGRKGHQQTFFSVHDDQQPVRVFVVRAKEETDRD